MTAAASAPVTIGVDIGTTSVKAVAVDTRGVVVDRCRVPHRVRADLPGLLEHDAGRAWRSGPRRAVAAVAGGRTVAGVGLAAMVPSVTAVDRRGIPRCPGVLYGDRRAGSGGGLPDLAPLLRWAAGEVPAAAGYWPAQAVAAVALGGQSAVDGAVVGGSPDLLHGSRWADDRVGDLGLQTDQLPAIVPMGSAIGTIGSAGGAAHGAVLAAGTVDALCEQLVAGADQVGDVLVVAGSTLVVWVVTDRWVAVPGLWTVPHTTADRVLVGGPSNAGALFVDWVRELLGFGGRWREPPVPADPHAVPVWLPYPRGERVPLHDPDRRAVLADLQVDHGPAAVWRAALEATGFVVRQLAETAGIPVKRVVATGGLARSGSWAAAVADAVGAPVDVVAVPEGAALGAALLARVAAGLDEAIDTTGRWAAVGRRWWPNERWQAAADGRYRRFMELTGTGG
jgi:xylulokinase